MGYCPLQCKTRAHGKIGKGAKQARKGAISGSCRLPVTVKCSVPAKGAFRVAPFTRKAPEWRLSRDAGLVRERYTTAYLSSKGKYSVADQIVNKQGV